MFTLADLHFESDVLEAMETLPEDLEAVYMHPMSDLSAILLTSSQGTREYSYASAATGKISISAQPYGFCNGC